MSSLLSYAVAVYVTVAIVKIFVSSAWTKETVVSSLKWPYNLAISIVNKVKGA